MIATPPSRPPPPCPTGWTRAGAWRRGRSSRSTGPRRSTSARASTSPRTSTIEGSVTGGCVESAVAQEAMAMLAEEGPAAEARHLRDLRRARRHRRPDVRRDRPHLHPRAARRGRARAATRAALEAIREERPAALATLLDGADAGREALRRRRRDAPAGSAAPALLERNVAQEARGLTIAGPLDRSATSARTARRWAAGCASTSRRSPSRRRWSSSGRSTSPRRSRRSPRASATA